MKKVLRLVAFVLTILLMNPLPSHIANAESKLKSDPVSKVGNSTASLVAHYKFDNDLSDSSGHGNDGSIDVGDITYVNGKVNQAAAFDGASCIEVKDSDSLDVNSTFTISVWLYKLEPESDVGYLPVLAKGYSNEYADYSAYTLYHESYGAEPALFVNAENGVSDRLTTGGTIADYNSWHMLTVVFNSNEESVEYYINGEFCDITAWEGGTLYQTEGSLCIGFAVILDDPDYYLGYMDDLRIYNSALDETDIKELYQESGSIINTYQSITVTPNKMAMLKSGGILTLTVTGTSIDGEKETITEEATYASSNTKIAAVSKNGTITTLSKGKAIITVTVGNLTRDIAITVN